MYQVLLFYRLLRIILHSYDNETTYWTHLSHFAVQIHSSLLKFRESEFNCTSIFEGEAHSYASHPVVLIASLVPESSRAAIVLRVRETRTQRGDRREVVLAMRTAEGLYTLLYEPVDEGPMPGRELLLRARTRPTDKAINSTLFYEFKN